MVANYLPYNSSIFAVYKPKGISSYDCLRQMARKGLFSSQERYGHIGTLDVFADGVLLISKGHATRLNDYVHLLLPKTYLAKGKLGMATNTGDLSGEIFSQDESKYLHDSIFKYEKSFLDNYWKQKFIGEYWQVPHQFSATKFQGRKLYKWAREGVFIPKEPVKRLINSLDVVDFCPPYVTFRTQVSSGTYIRKLFEEMAQAIGTVGHLCELKREAVGDINANENNCELTAISWEKLLPIPFFRFDQTMTLELLSGKKIPVPHYLNAQEHSLIAYCDSENRLLGLLSPNFESNCLQIKVNLWDAKSFRAHYNLNELAPNNVC